MLLVVNAPKDFQKKPVEGEDRSTMGRARLGQKLRESFHFFRQAEQMLRGRGEQWSHCGYRTTARRNVTVFY
jgi:hypothetical protein